MEAKYMTEEFFKAERLIECSVPEIHQLIKRSGFIAMSWGAHNFANVENKLLRFKVQGHHFKGLVWIGLNGKDLYNIYLSQGRVSDNGCYKHVETIEDVYNDVLIEILDNRIEKIADYVR